MVRREPIMAEKSENMADFWGVVGGRVLVRDKNWQRWGLEVILKKVDMRLFKYENVFLFLEGQLNYSLQKTKNYGNYGSHF